MQRVVVRANQQAVWIVIKRPAVFHRVSGGIQLQHFLRFALADVDLITLSVEFNR
ncbi:hypothetical protein IB231_13635 [Pantoea sp. PNT02]|nr:hypothetical protein [Pantoea sp. PNT02]